MQIGITERGDAGLDLSWAQKLNTVDGVIVITKNLNRACANAILSSTKPVIVHCTCTGWGGTFMEPNVPRYETQLMQLEALIANGFPPENCVIRIDPIIPTGEGLEKVRLVLKKVLEMRIPVRRVRISILDMYRHARDRLDKQFFPDVYDGRFYPSYAQIAGVISCLENFPQFEFESCAEPILASKSSVVEARGCVSKKDLKIMFKDKVPVINAVNGQNRKGCLCLQCKKELLENRRQCPHGCLYCYWK